MGKIRHIKAKSHLHENLQMKFWTKPEDAGCSNYCSWIVASKQSQGVALKLFVLLQQHKSRRRDKWPLSSW